MKTCEILAASHEHAGRVCGKGERIELADAVAASLAERDPPIVKIVGSAPPAAAPKTHLSTVKKG